MSSSQIQKLLDESNLDLQQLSEQTGLRVESIQSFDQRVQKISAELEKISKVLDIHPLEVLSMSFENTQSPSALHIKDLCCLKNLKCCKN